MQGNELHEIAANYEKQTVEVWKDMDHFSFGRGIAMEYDLTLSDVETLFNEILHEYVRGKRKFWLLGCFISGLYADVIEEDDTITLYPEKYLPLNVAGLGYRHPRGTLEIVGNTGWWTGRFMTGGEIRIRGNAGRRLGAGMRGGRIVVEGNAEFGVGEFMKDGEILIKGDASWIGNEMRGGVIRIVGECELIAGSRTGGEIYLLRAGEWVKI